MIRIKIYIHKASFWSFWIKISRQVLKNTQIFLKLAKTNNWNKKRYNYNKLDKKSEITQNWIEILNSLENISN